MLFHLSATYPFAFTLLALLVMGVPILVTKFSRGAGTWSPSDIYAGVH